MLAKIWWRVRSRMRRLLNQGLGSSYTVKRVNSADDDKEVSMRLLAIIALSSFSLCVIVLYLGSHMLHLSLWRWTRYCDSGKINGTWVGPVPEFPATRYMFNIDEKDSCSYEYILGFERLSRKIPSDLRIEVWGDRAQLQLTSALMCWVSGIVPWENDVSLPIFPVPIGGSDSTGFTWDRNDKCFDGAPEPDVSECHKLTGQKKSECYFNKLQFAWQIPTEVIRENPLVNKVHNVFGRFSSDESVNSGKDPSEWISPMIKYRWADTTKQLERRLKKWIDIKTKALTRVRGSKSSASQNQELEKEIDDILPLPNVLIISANLFEAPGSENFLKNLQNFFQLLALNHDLLHRVKVIFLEPNMAYNPTDFSLPPVKSEPQNSKMVMQSVIANEPNLRRQRATELAASYGVPVIRTAHLTSSWASFGLSTDVNYPQLSQHRAQLVLNFIKHLRT